MSDYYENDCINKPIIGTQNTSRVIEIETYRDKLSKIDFVFGTLQSLLLIVNVTYLTYSVIRKHRMSV